MLMQSCILLNYGIKILLEYKIHVANSCILDTFGTCSDDLKPKHGIDLNKIHNCAKDENLSKDFEIMSELKINTDPTVVLNGAVDPGYIDGEDLLNWICTSFSASPKICS